MKAKPYLGSIHDSKNELESFHACVVKSCKNISGDLQLHQTITSFVSSGSQKKKLNLKRFARSIIASRDEPLKLYLDSSFLKSGTYNSPVIIQV